MSRPSPSAAMTAPQALHPHHHPYQFGAGIGLLALSIPLMLVLLRQDAAATSASIWLPHWHLAADLITVLVALLIFITGYRAILSPRKGAVVWLGVGFLGVALLGFLNVVSHAELAEDLRPAARQASLGFSLAARLVAAVVLLVYAALPAVPDVSPARKRTAVGIMLTGILLAGYLARTTSALLPVLFDGQDRPTAFYWSLQITSVILHLSTLYVFWQRRSTLEQECLMALIFAAALSAVAGLFFSLSLGLSHTGLHSAGNVYQVGAYLYLFHATFNEALSRPMQRLEMLYQRENATLTAAPDGVIWVDQEGTIVLANPAMQALSAYPPKELIGQNVSIFLPPHLRERHARSMRDFFHAPHSRAMGIMDLRLYRRDGSLQPVDISLGYWEVDGKPLPLPTCAT